MIHVVRDRATAQQMQEMMETLETYVKPAVDIERSVLAGGGAMHADCEFALLEDGSRQEFIWDADWNLATQEVTFESLINIRPRQNNRSLELQDPSLRAQVEKVTRNLLGGV